MDLFEYTQKVSNNKSSPLADRMRPEKLEDFVGQEHIVGKDKLLYRTIKSDKLSSIILYGPPGTGKTTLAKIISNESNLEYKQINATIAGIKDIREVIELAKENINLYNKRTILFIDEIHRFNKSQQDALLKYVEDGTIILIGATTENPFFEVNKALISRAIILELKALDDTDIYNIVINAINDKNNGYGEYDLEVTEDALKFLVNSANGDARVALNGLEIAVSTSSMDEDGILRIGIDTMEDCIQKKVVSYEKNGDEHFDTVSAFIKSIRGSDPDAALYWLGKMLYAGEDIKFIARRLIISASEDIGNADPNALNIAVSGFNAINIIGMPEARIVLSQVTTYLASVPKSNAAYLGINKVMSDIENKRLYPVPYHLKDSSYQGAKKLGRGDTYKYPHDYENAYVKQNYLPNEMIGTKYYSPKNIGEEEKIKNYLEKINKG